MASPELLAVLEESRDLGFLGPGPVDDQLAHAEALARLIGGCRGPLLDLGSGGGLPGLALAQAWPEASGLLLDARQRRCAFLRESLVRLGFDVRITVACGRAERLAREPDLRGRFELVVARSFASPAVTAECAVGFLAGGGRLVVTEPPAGDAEVSVQRWPPEGLAKLGFSVAVPTRSGATGAVIITLEHEADDRWPRREGIPAKRPLW